MLDCSLQQRLTGLPWSVLPDRFQRNVIVFAKPLKAYL